MNNLEVEPQQLATNAEKEYAPDLEIKAAVLQSILNNPNLKNQQINVDVYNGEVKLTGSVQTSNQKADAEAAARAIPNVRNVDSNALTVTNRGAGRP